MKEREKQMICMGSIVKDRVTGFVGEIVSITTYKYETTHYFVQPRKLQSNGLPAEGESFSVERLVEVAEKKPIQCFTIALDTGVTTKESSK